MRLVRVDFNMEPLFTSERFSGKLQLGEKVIAYTTDDEVPFGFEATVREIRKEKEWPEGYYLDCDYTSHRLEGDELGLEH